MSVSKLARAGRIDSRASDLNSRASGLSSQLNSIATEVLLFAGMMHTNANGEFTQEDRDKYGDAFLQTLTGLQQTLSRFQPLADIESGSVTPQDWLATQDAAAIAEFSKQFDSGR